MFVWSWVTKSFDKFDNLPSSRVGELLETRSRNVTCLCLYSAGTHRFLKCSPRRPISVIRKTPLKLNSVHWRIIISTSLPEYYSRNLHSVNALNSYFDPYYYSFLFYHVTCCYYHCICRISYTDNIKYYKGVNSADIMKALQHSWLIPGISFFSLRCSPNCSYLDGCRFLLFRLCASSYSIWNSIIDSKSKCQPHLYFDHVCVHLETMCVT